MVTAQCIPTILINLTCSLQVILLALPLIFVPLVAAMDGAADAPVVAAAGVVALSTFAMWLKRVTMKDDAGAAQLAAQLKDHDIDSDETLRMVVDTGMHDACMMHA